MSNRKVETDEHGRVFTGSQWEKVPKGKRWNPDKVCFEDDPDYKEPSGKKEPEKSK